MGPDEWQALEALQAFGALVEVDEQRAGCQNRLR
jgi:hypothetical protein